ncbi:GNAT family N-acetyltransferase [Streptosporangium sp. NPDC049248]|uniref:GNAT family N-acetyltransferase n=1 Tax=Streptosporangium sp. NPDC049248 TaxID=3155651 RepID=UPI00344602F3
MSVPAMSVPTPTVRRAVPQDANRLYELSLRAISESAAAHYTAEQLAAWSRRRNLDGHARMIDQTETFVALVAGQVAGFANVALRPVGQLHRGEVDQLFVGPGHGGRGVARLLLTAVENAARADEVEELRTHASWRAVPVFERLGYRRVEVETVHLEDQTLSRVRMHKSLSGLGSGAAD